MGNQFESGLYYSLLHNGISDIHDLVTDNNEIIKSLKFEETENTSTCCGVN
jgi:hypothetical protein